MKHKDIFNLAVRLLGLIFLYHGLQAVPNAISQIIASFPHEIAPGMKQGMRFGRFVSGVVLAGWPLLVSYWLLRGAPFLMRAAYPDAPASTKEETQGGGGL